MFEAICMAIVMFALSVTNYKIFAIKMCMTLTLMFKIVQKSNVDMPVK